MEMQKLTPLMTQYWEIKNQHLDKILLFRMGDFYEMFFDDAIKAAPLLNIALTSRSKSQGQDVPMCGVPYHSIGPQINKLLQANLKVAICDQVENPRDAKTIVKRAVVRIVTPGLAYDPDTISSEKSLFVASFLESKSANFCFSAVDASTGEVVSASNLSTEQLASWIEKLSPQEFLLETGVEPPVFINKLVTYRERMNSQSCESFLLDYVKSTQGDELSKTLKKPKRLQTNFLRISPTTMRHLEIFTTSDGGQYGSLYDAVNFTKTAMGSRLLKKRLATPFSTLNDIEAEQDCVQKYFEDEILRHSVREQLSHIGDLERRTVKLTNPLCNARDVQTLGKSLKSSLKVLEELKNSDFNLISLLKTYSEKINQTLQDELPHSIKDGHLIRPQINSLLDEYVDLSSHAQEKLSQIETKEREASGIQSLKVKYNSIFGYSFEITKSNLGKIPAHFIRKQTLASAERFVTNELIELEDKILSSQQKRCDFELEIFNELKKDCLSKAQEFLEIAENLALIDLQSSFAQLAFEQNYSKPKFSADEIALEASRHPVFEKISRDLFVPNDIHLSSGHCMLLTGPNMAGKSTLMRQVALTSMLAQCGSFVPAKAARLPVFDEIFTRIGASDHLVKGLSTFMVEMSETAEIIGRASKNSLVILDEIGRGTSTYDGMSLAQSILEHFISNIKSYSFFATHYHELTELAKEHQEICNYHMSIEEFGGKLIFLRKLKPGPASRSYGIEVAKEAGLPQAVTKRAQHLLKNLSAKYHDSGQNQLSLSLSVETNLPDSNEKLKPSKHSLEKLEQSAHWQDFRSVFYDC
jgi:DNA mismatch repair protein MutS